MFGGDLDLRRPEWTGMRDVSLPQSEVVTRALQHVNGLLRGGQVGQTPADEGRVGILPDPPRRLHTGGGAVLPSYPLVSKRGYPG